ncbi:hypothetical protein [Falsirhodobacter sp. 20TX0035]|uniref:hypothetical protein n=1 Tax=Falsirhodobacter sp. 20TX0035 TaxID=3022019 RepID=UPI00232C3667|nr:hypothetical protein [Falsirhodobacter sp. 20TX0035]MDB6453914.1 hypothetical protein [Falsirhodobacter sp. 20TX0035]
MSDDSRLKRYTEIAKTQGEEGSHPSTVAVHRRPAERGDGTRRTEHFARIERGREA